MYDVADNQIALLSSTVKYQLGIQALRQILRQTGVVLVGADGFFITQRAPFFL